MNHLTSAFLVRLLIGLVFVRAVVLWLVLVVLILLPRMVCVSGSRLALRREEVPFLAGAVPV
jgi:hypothetical protein